MNLHKYFTSTLIAVLALTQLSVVAHSSTTNKVIYPAIKQINKGYVGLRYRNVPKGIQDLGGWVVGDANVKRPYGVSHRKKGNQQMLWFEFIIYQGSQQQPMYQVIDILNLPKLGRSDQLAVGGQCVQNGVRDPEIIAIVKYEETEYWKQIKKAWRSNRRTGKFEQISNRNIVCENPGWGV